MNDNRIKYLKLALLVASAMFVFFYLFSRPVMVQDQSYHLFADTRSLLGIPNAMDVLSNIFFAFTGLLGMWEVARLSGIETKKSWWWFFFSILLIAPGSAYYHWNPNDVTLVWDRLPMSMGFMALYILLLCEHLDFKIQRYLFPALVFGIGSVMVWVLTTDLRFYFWVQFSSFVTIPFILFLFPSRFSHKGYYGVTLVFYALAKWTEIKDKEIFYETGEMVSGHTLKHVLAAIGLLALWWMVRTRKRQEVEASSFGGIGNTSGKLEELS